jgi:hypothetical protein
MPNAFGVEHGPISKKDGPRKTVPDWMAPVLPGSTVRAYDRSKRRKLEAASGNLGARVGGATAGGLAGLGLAAVAGRKFKPLREGMKVAGHQVSGGTMRGWTQSTLSGAGAGAGGGVAAGYHLGRVKENKKKYGYR